MDSSPEPPPAGLTKLPIVMISMSRWDGDFSSAAWSLAKTFARTRPVLYVDYPYTLTDIVRERKDERVKRRRQSLLWRKQPLLKLEHFGGQLYGLTPPAMLPAMRLRPGPVYQALHQYNDRLMARSIQQGLAELGHDDFIFFNSFNPLYLTSLPAGFRPRLFLYQSRDNLRALEPYLRKHGEAGERQAIRNADFS
ncbi:MAG: group 1 glycosyl transferase, partial [Cyclonatronaceae bacterium]